MFLFFSLFVIFVNFSKKMNLFFHFFILPLFFVFAFLFIGFVFLSLFYKFSTFGQVKGNARYGRSRHPPSNQSYRVRKVNLATLNSK